MSIKVMSRVWDNSKLKGSGLLLLVALADNADDDGICWPGVDHLAGKIRMSPRQTQRLINLIIERKELYRQIGGNGKGTRTRYLVAVGLTNAQAGESLQKHFGMTRDQAVAEVLSKDDKLTPKENDERVTQLCPEKGDIVTHKMATTVIEPSESTDTFPSTENVSVSQPANPPNPVEANQNRGEGQLASQPSLFASPDLKPTDQQSSVENPPVPTSGITGKKSDDDKISKRGRKAKTPTDPFFVFEQIDGKTVYTGPFKDMAKAQRHAAEHGTVTQQQAIPPGSTIRPVPKVVQPWDVLGEAIATHLFGAKDRAGINAVFGRVAPILHGDKRGGNCNGLIAYECERQSKDKADLDYAKLAADVAEFWKWHRRVKPSVTELKVCFKVIDAWQEWRGKQKPALDMSQYTIIEPDNYISPTPAR